MKRLEINVLLKGHLLVFYTYLIYDWILEGWVIIMQQLKLTKRQKEEYTKIDKKIQSVKKRARRRYRGRPGLQVKYATQCLQELYPSPEVINNPDYLLWRYTKLEHRESTWNNIWLPMIMPIMSFSFVYDAFENLSIELTSLKEYIPLISMMSFSEQLLVVFLLILVVIGVVSFGYSICNVWKLIILSISRNADTTIIENERIILKALLIKNGVLLNEDEVTTRLCDTR